jgi:hypothetical protein
MTERVKLQDMGERHKDTKTLADRFAEAIIACPRCHHDALMTDIIDSLCSECRLCEDEADWMDEDEADGGSPWGR